MKLLKIYLILVFLTILIFASIKILFFNNLLFQNTFGNQLSYHRINELFESYKKSQWLGYASIPAFIFLRVFFTSIFIYIGLFYVNLNVGFRQIFTISLWADIAFLVSAFTKLVALILLKEVNSLADLQFQPFSLLSLLDIKSLDPIFLYPLSLVNLFELGYLAGLTWLLAKFLRKTSGEKNFEFWKSFRVVTVSYGSGLLLWVMLIMFLSLNYS